MPYSNSLQMGTGKVGVPKIKICGLTNPKEAAFLNENKVDYAGFVLFFEKSKRCISIERATEIFAALDENIKRVAVVVNPDLEQMAAIKEAGFDYIQIHGDIPEGGDNVGIDIIKAFNVDDMSDYEKYALIPRVVGFVFDAAKPGSGQVFDWKLMDSIPAGDKPFCLGGGLNASNIQEAIDYVEPFAVDVSSGVENDSGEGKNEKKIKAFVDAVREKYTKKTKK